MAKLAAGGTIGQDNLDEARFDVDVAKASLASVKADVQAAIANIQAAEASVRKVKADRKSADAKVNVAMSTVERLKTLMEYTVLRAPYDGVVTGRIVDLGSYVQAGRK